MYPHRHLYCQDVKFLLDETGQSFLLFHFPSTCRKEENTVAAKVDSKCWESAIKENKQTKKSSNNRKKKQKNTKKEQKRVKEREKGGGTLHFSPVVMREIKNEEKIFFQKLTVKHNSNMRENYCKKLRWKRAIQ